MNHDDLDRALHQAGERWRSRQSTPPEPNLARLADVRRTWTGGAKLWAPIAAVAGVAAVLAVVIVPLALNRSGDPGPVGAGPTGPGPTGPGTGPSTARPVEGIGTLLREADGTVKLCSAVAVALSLPPAGAGCSPVFVLATGVEERWFTQQATSGQSWSEGVRVEGSYANGTLAVNKVEAFTPDFAPMTEPPVPCPAPANGWPLGYGLSETEYATAFNSLAEHVRSRPQTYTDVWEGHPDGPPSAEHSYLPTRAVYVVGTTGDVAAARAELAALYPGNLCVHKVAKTAAELDVIANKLRSVSSTPIEAESRVIENKVRVKVVALDPATNAVLDSVGRENLILEEPLLQWAD